MLVQQLTMLVLGGQASLTGAVVGVTTITLLSESLRNLERGFSLGSISIPAIFGASQIVLGFVFILMMVFRPQGLMGDKEVRLVVPKD
jgi:branched-chain amino acid transport system permease protein